MPHRVSNWNFTDRGSATLHNDTFRGKGNATYTASSMKQNQGFASVIATFPQGSFATCRYPVTPEQQRTPAENTWHPEFVVPDPAPNPAMAAAAAAAGVEPEVRRYNITNTKPLPIPFCERPGYEEEQRAQAAAKRAAYEAFKAHRISSTGGDVIPPDFYHHTQHAPVHINTMLKAGEMNRPSKPRVGTTPVERAAAAASQAQMQATLRARAAEEDAAQEAAERRARARRQGEEDYAAGNYRQVAVDPRFAQQGAPHYYNVPTRSPGQQGW